jgi:hypothetical protein
MSKLIDMNEHRDKKVQLKFEGLIYKLNNLNKLPGIHREAMSELIDYVLEEVKVNVLDYYDGYYDEDEPNISSFNTQELLKDLLDISCGNATVERDN